ncbi:hypothetical protein TURU_104416 [Turdus rufiventris]|nr:hypothetical protein TURU_104416 [Turdus rufiventris]
MFQRKRSVSFGGYGWIDKTMLASLKIKDVESQQALGRCQDPVLVDVLMYDLTPAGSRDGAFVPRTGKLLEVL